MFGEPTRRDLEFDAVIAAVTRYNKRKNIAHRAEPPKKSYFGGDALHKKAVEKRRKRKRGGKK